MSRTSQALVHLLDQPELLATVQNLAPAVLHQVIATLGLEDSAELLALTTTEQLVGVFDHDLWSNERPGEAERFNPARFGVWLEVMLERGDRFVAERLSEMDEDFLASALGRQMFVLSSERQTSDLDEDMDDEAMADKLLDNHLVLELEGYLLVGRSHDAWDAWTSALLALDRDQHGFLVRILDRLLCASEAESEDHGGLLGLLSSFEQLEEDVAADREERRAEEGHIAPEQAKAFLALAASRPDDETDPISKAYFRSWKERPLERSRMAAPPEWVRALPKLAAAPSAPLPSNTPLGRAIKAEPDAYVRDLAFLSNVLLAGHAYAGRRFRPQEAALAAFALASDAYRPGTSLITAFKRAWATHTTNGTLRAFIARATSVTR